MATKTEHIRFDAEPDLVAALRQQSAATGCPVAEYIRRAVRLALFGDAQAARQTTKQPTPPVLFTAARQGNSIEI